MLEDGNSPSDLLYWLSPHTIEEITLPEKFEHDEVDLHMICVDWHPIADEDNMYKHEYIIVYMWNKLKEFKNRLKYCTESSHILRASKHRAF